MKYMKLVEQVLNEANDNTEEEKLLMWIAKIKKDCKPYIDFVNKNKLFGRQMPFFRAVYTKDIGITMRRRKDRKPLNTHPFFNEYINTFLKSNGVIPRSEAVFAKAERTVGFYGRTYYMFPIGKKFDFYFLKGKTLTKKGIASIDDLTANFGIARKNVEKVKLDLSAELEDVKGKSTKELKKKYNELVMKYEVENHPNVEEQKKAMDLIEDLEVVKNQLIDTTPEYVIDVDKYHLLDWETWTTYLNKPQSYGNNRFKVFD